MASSNVTKLDPSSDAFKRILYNLQVSLRGTNVSGVHIWFVDTPSLRAKYERQTSAGGLELPSWVDVDGLPAFNPVQEVCARGFRAPEDGSGLSFRTGHVDLSAVGDRNQHQFLLCRVAVGRAYALLEPDAPKSIPDGYDSLYVHHDDEDAAEAAAEGAVGVHSHEYVVMNPAQVLPEYIVHFDFDPADAVLGPPPSATMTLEERRDHFRAKIDEVRGEVSRALSVLGPSLGNRTEEMLSDLTTKYETALHASTQPEPLLEERKRAVHEGIRRITTKLEQVRSNSEAVYEEVCKRMQDALATLEALTKRKTAVLLSEELELRRQLRQLQSAEAMVPHLQETLQPTAFVEAWEAHQALRRELISQMTGAGATMVGEALDAVKPDLKVVGEIDVVAATEEAIARGGGAAAAAASGSGRVGASAMATRLFAGSGATGTGGLGDSSASAMPLSATWQSFMHHEAGVPNPVPVPASGPRAGLAPPPASAVALLDSIVGQSPAGRGTGQAEVERARALASLARAELRSIKERAAALPDAQAALGEAAVAEQEGRVGAAEAALATAERRAGVTGRASAAEASSAAGPASPTARDDDEAALDAGAYPRADLRSRNVPNAHPRLAPPSGITSATPMRSAPEPVSVFESSSSSAAAAAAAAAAASAAGATRTPASSRVKQSRSPTRNSQQHLERVISRNRLSVEAARRHRFTGLDSDSLDALAFSGSTILTGKAAHDVYACLPFVRPETIDPTTGLPTDAYGTKAPVPPGCSLVFSTATAPSADFASLAGALARTQGPTVLLISAGDAVFGAYASQTWNFDGRFHGDVSSFLFSVTTDVRIPYVGRIAGPVQHTDGEQRAQYEREFQARQEKWMMAMQQLRAEAEEQGVIFNESAEVVANPGGFDLSPFSIAPPRHRPWKRVDAQFSDEGRLSMGLTDLVIDGDLTRCSSEIESTFGIGLRPGSVEAQTLLAGTHEFSISELEVWAVGEPAFEGVEEGSADMPMAGYA